MQKTETVDIYHPGHIVLDDGNPVPSELSLVASQVACNLHRGARQAQDQAIAAGIYAELPALGYFEPDSAAYLKDRYVLRDAQGDAWIIRGRPSVRTRFPATAHVRCLLTLLAVKPFSDYQETSTVAIGLSASSEDAIVTP